MPSYSEPLANKLLKTGYHLKQTPRTRSWEIFLKADNTFSFQFGRLDARSGNSTWGNHLKLAIKDFNKGGTYEQDYSKWKTRILTNIDVNTRPLMKLAVEQQYEALNSFRSKITSFPKNFKRYSEENQNQMILPFHLAAIPLPITIAALENNLSAYNPIVNALVEEKIAITDISEYQHLPVEWVRKLLY
jgi:hypothetical protein